MAPPVNSNYSGANLGCHVTHVDERIGTLLHSSALDKFAEHHGVPVEGKPPSSLLSGARSAASVASSKALSNLAKVEALEAEIANEKQKQRAALKQLGSAAR